MPMMPMDPAKDVRAVRAFLVRRLLKLSDREVSSPMEALPKVRWRARRMGTWSSGRGSESLMTEPSCSSTILVAYWWASSGLWVTMTTSRSWATSLSRSMIWMEVSESSAPVGSSARRMRGLLTRALAMATRCICPPESWLGRLFTCWPSPTCSRACLARSRRSCRCTPEMVRASSTLDRMLWWGIRL